MHILLIDDESNFVSQLKWYFSKHGHSVTTALDGEEGWKLFLCTPNTFDVIVTDVRMPVLDGIALMKLLREKGYDIPVIMMTGYKDIKVSVEALRLGAFDFLLKPFTPQELDKTLEKLESVQQSKKKQLAILPFFSEDIQMSMATDTTLISTVVWFFQSRVRLFCQLHKVDVRNIGLCLHEALVNAIIHGNLEVSSFIKERVSFEKFDKLIRQREAEEKFAQRQVVLRCKITPDSLTFEIEDQGKGFDTEKLQMFDPLNILDDCDTAHIPTSGRGLLIITSYMDRVFWNDRGNCITMIKQFQGE